MSRLKGVAARLRALVQPGASERRADEEFAFHVDMEAARLVMEGVPGDRARQEALARFGGFERYRQEMREGRRANWFHDLRDDLRYGTRSLIRQKGLTSIAIISLAVGIGANAAVFSVVNSILLHPRAVRDAAQLVEIYSGDVRQPYQTTSYPSYLDFRARNSVFSGFAAYGLGWQFRLGGSEEVREVWGEVVSGNYFDVLGVRAQLGRTFLPEEDSVPGRNPVVVISHALWQRHFSGDSTVIGRSISLNGHPVTVIGVSPPRYNGMMNGWGTDIWLPAMMAPVLDRASGGLMLTSRGSKWVTMVGRLKAGVSLERARNEFTVLVAGLRADHPEEWSDTDVSPTREYFASLLPERETRVHPSARPAVQALTALLFVVINLVLVIACMNLAGLLFARGVSRRSEIGVRLALGAGRTRIIRQLLTESVLLAVTAGVAGLLLSVWALAALLTSMPPLPEGIRLALDVRLDWRVVAYTVAFSLLTGLLFGLAPALQSSRSALSSVLKEGASSMSGRSRPSRSRRLLIVGQVAASLLLLIGAGLMTRSLGNIRPVSLGFPSEDFVVAPVSLDEQYDRRSAQRFFEEVSRTVAGMPGVEGVSLVDGMPGGFLSRTRRSIGIEGHVPRPGEDTEFDASIVSPGYFTTMHVPFVLGRDFAVRDRDGAPCVGIVNEAFAARFLGGPGSALGRSLIRYRGETVAPERCQVVGVIRDRAWQSLQAEPRPFFALPLLQSNERTMTMLVHTRGGPTPYVRSIRKAMQSLDPSIPVADVRTLADSFGATLYPFRLFGLVLAAGGLMALLLATIGIYGTVSYSVAQRTREVGIRMALGAERADILRVVVGQGMAVVAWGLAFGLLLGAGLTWVLDHLPPDLSLLFGVSALDIGTFAVVTLLLAGVALIACYVPARRASRVDPGITLRGL